MKKIVGAQVLVVANAAEAPKPQFLGINIPVRGRRKLVQLWMEKKAALRCATSKSPRPRDGIFIICTGESKVAQT